MRGSYAPTVLNVVQLIGWTIFEFVVMGVAASVIARTVFGTGSYAAWAAVFAVIVIIMGVGGPIGVVRQWLEKFAVWVALATGVWLTVHVFTTMDVAALVRQPGDGSLPFGSGVDLAIALPISWLPLVADYNRFARSTRGGFWGTMLGFFVTNAWFLSLGVLLLLGSRVAQEPKDFAAAIAVTAGWIALLILLADETHNAWADLYSSAVSLQNLFPKVKQRWLIVVIGAVCFLAALFVDITRYQNFLYVIGSFFVPLFGMVTADFYVLKRRRYRVKEFYACAGRVLAHAGRECTGDDRLGRRDCRLSPGKPGDPRGDSPGTGRRSFPRPWESRAGRCPASWWPSCSPLHSDLRAAPARKGYWRTPHDRSNDEELRRHRGRAPRPGQEQAPAHPPHHQLGGDERHGQRHPRPRRPSRDGARPRGS